MAKKLPPLNWLRTFEAAATSMSFTAAARELGITQSAVSQQVRLLESHLGRPLFHRLPRGLRLTEAGDALLPLLGDAFARIAEGTAEIFGDIDRVRLLVRATTSFAALWLVPRLGRFRARHPEIEFRLTSSIWPADYPDPAVDLEIRYGTGRWSGLRADRLTWDELFPVCSPDWARGAQKLEKPEDLARCTLLHAFGFRDGWPEWLAKAGLTDKVDGASGLEFDLGLAALDLAERGVGVALGRTCYAAERIAAGRLIVPFDIRLPTDEAFYLVSAEGRTPTADATAFRDWLLEEAAGARRAR
ncbi:MAG TPA: transcriptional regulator GcvA [Hypericibacter adhaerens]|jgi:LysR family glycine cleavage system transcriptional activator|uniref:transcriptional regulator GcvA n=1 Tax=Hypericibacter adhaerens TaxID=2602016 RepID=UPI002BED13DF|nr:transcriptional regulator GcvA [Hypericibacter adhaerens]HWA42790.1 transcriptional regulator GcvA [Hypericibacter adhaerens]